MAIEATFQDLLAAFRGLRDALASLQLTVVEDRPLRNEVLLVERLGNAVDDLSGWAEEGVAAATEALAAVGHPLDAYRARHALAGANQSFIRLEYRFFADAMSCEQLDELATFARRRGREWQGWSGSVMHAIAQCRAPLHTLDSALLASWQELSERLGNAGVSVQSTNIGQQISTQARDGGGAALPSSAAVNDALR